MIKRRKWVVIIKVTMAYCNKLYEIWRRTMFWSSIELLLLHSLDSSSASRWVTIRWPLAASKSLTRMEEACIRLLLWLTTWSSRLCLRWSFGLKLFYTRINLHIGKLSTSFLSQSTWFSAMYGTFTHLKILNFSAPLPFASTLYGSWSLQKCSTCSQDISARFLRRKMRVPSFTSCQLDFSKTTSPVMQLYTLE